MNIAVKWKNLAIELFLNRVLNVFIWTLNNLKVISKIISIPKNYYIQHNNFTSRYLSIKSIPKSLFYTSVILHNENRKSENRIFMLLRYYGKYTITILLIYDVYTDSTSCFSLLDKKQINSHAQFYSCKIQVSTHTSVILLPIHNVILFRFLFFFSQFVLHSILGNVNKCCWFATYEAVSVVFETS